MPYQELSNGLYRIHQPAQKCGLKVDHYGILDIGNNLQIPGADREQPTVVHQTPPRIRADRLADTGPFSVVESIGDIEGARARLRNALQDPEYRVLKNNCEHFANFIGRGRATSKQVQGVVGIGLAMLLVWWAIRDS